MFISQNIHIRPFLINWTFVYSIYRALKMDPLATIPSFLRLRSYKCKHIQVDVPVLYMNASAFYVNACNPLIKFNSRLDDN